MRYDKYSIDEVIATLKHHNGMVYLTAESLECSPQTVYNYAKRYPEIQEVIDSSRGRVIDLAENKLKAAIEREDNWAIGFALKTIGKDRGYVEKSIVEKSQVNIDIESLSNEQLTRLANGEDISSILSSNTD